MRRDLPPAAPSEGVIDEAWCDGGRLHVRGWAAAGGAALSSLRLHTGHGALDPVEAALGLPSADVAAARPDLPRAAEARFQACFADTGCAADASGPADDRLVMVEPWFGASAGRALVRLHAPQLPQPSRRLQDDIGAGFPGVGLEFLGHFVQFAGLEGGDAVLDVGCGFGRMAYALAYYLGPAGRYDGFDIMRPHIDWAAANLTPARPNFTFRHVDLFNRHYNRRGRLRADAFAFPYPDASFDLVGVTSVFTHLSGREVRHYLGEIARVLRPGGRCLATWFLMDDASREGVAAGRASEALRHRWGDGYVSRRWMPEWAVGFDEPRVREWVAERGLAVRLTRHGGWSGRSGGASYQDILVLERDARVTDPRPLARDG